MMHTLDIQQLIVSIGEKQIINGVDLSINSGEIHAVMGPNGSGKSTLASTLMGKPHCRVASGAIRFDGADITTTSPTDRARKGLFLGFQYPVEIPGVAGQQMLRLSYNSIALSQGRPALSPKEFNERLKSAAAQLHLPTEFLHRSLNEGFSGGEKKKMEMLQCRVLEPAIAILDETDSGLDVDALKMISTGIRSIVDTTNTGVLLITHYQRILDYVKPHVVHVFVGGRIVESGGPELAEKIEREGYKSYVG